MSDSEDANSRRAARPSTPPFRGPAGPGSRPPLTPPAPASGKGMGGTPGQAGSRTPTVPFAVPPAGPRGRPATPARGARKPAPTPEQGTAETPYGQPAEGARVPSATPPRPETAAAVEAIPAYGSAPPPSVAATLKSISEFTIVDAADAPPDGEAAEGGLATYDPPTVTAHTGDGLEEGAPSDDYQATAPGHDARWVPAPADEGSTSVGMPPGDDAPIVLEPASEEPLYDSPTADLDTVLSAPPLEADHLFDAAEPSEGASALAGLGYEDPSSDDAAPGAPRAPEPDRTSASREPAEGEPVFIGGDPTMRFVAESLEEIARGVRAGEIAVPAIDPAAEPPAVLAAVLAAILAPRQ